MNCKTCPHLVVLSCRNGLSGPCFAPKPLMKELTVLQLKEETREADIHALAVDIASLFVSRSVDLVEAIEQKIRRQI